MFQLLWFSFSWGNELLAGASKENRAQITQGLGVQGTFQVELCDERFRGLCI